jgi:hypothetical protein
VGPTCQPAEEREGGGAGGAGRVGRKDLWAAGWVGLFRFFPFLFFKSISNPFKFKPFTSFQIQILTQISPTILRLFENLLNNFSTYFKFKLSFFFFLIQTFTPIFTIIFKDFSQKFFKTFIITPQTKLMHSNMMHKHLFDSNY